MGVEVLLSQRNITPEIVRRMTNRLHEVDPDKRQAWSIPHAFAIEFGEWGKTGLYEMPIKHPSLKLNQTKPFFESSAFLGIDPEDQHSIRLDTAAVKFATVMMGIEMALSPDRRINIEYLLRWHNDAVKPFQRLRIARPKNLFFVNLTQAGWQNLVELTNQDKSHSVVFSPEGIPVLHTILRSIIGESTEDIRRDIVPAYIRLIGQDYKPKQKKGKERAAYKSNFPTQAEANVIFDRLVNS